MEIKWNLFRLFFSILGLSLISGTSKAVNNEGDPSSSALLPRILGMHGLDKPLGEYSPQLAKTISFGVSRGENFSILLKIQTDRCRKLYIGKFEQKGGKVANLSFDAFRVEKFQIKYPSYEGAPVEPVLDPMIPLSTQPTLCPSSLNPQEPQWYVLDFFPPEDILPGIYHSVFSLEGRGNFTVHLKVWKMKLHQEFHLYAGNNSWFNLLGHYGKWIPGEGVLGHAYLDLLKHMHINPFESWTQDPPIIYDPSGQPLLDLENSPNPEDSFMAVYRDYLGTEKINLPNPFSGYTTVDPILYLKAIENTIHHYGWEGRAFIYLFDEPTPNDYDTVIERGKIVRQFAPSLKTLVTTHYVPTLEPYIDIWVPILNFMEKPGYPDPEVYKRLQAKGQEVWLYISCMSHGCDNEVDGGTPDFVIDRKSVYIRAFGAFAHKYNADAILYWRLNHAYSQYPTRDPWTDQWYFSGNGDGTLLYPGRPGIYGLTTHQPISSLRIQAVEEALHDNWYYKKMDELKVKPSWWPSALDNLINSPTQWDKNYSSYQELTERIGNYLHAKGPKSSP